MAVTDGVDSVLRVSSAMVGDCRETATDGHAVSGGTAGGAGICISGSCEAPVAGMRAVGEVAQLSKISEGTFDIVVIEDTADGLATDVLCDNAVITAEEREDAAAFEDGASALLDGPDSVPRWAAFPRAAEVLQISFISVKCGQTELRRLRKIVFRYENSLILYDKNDKLENITYIALAQGIDKVIIDFFVRLG